MKPVKQPVPINFAGGIDNKTDPWQSAASEFLALNNMVFSVGGRLTKRNGFPSFGKTISNAPSVSSQTYGATVAAGKLAAAYKDELVIADGFNLFSYLEESNSWAYKGRYLVCDQSSTSVVRNGSNQQNSDSAVNATLGQTLYAYEDSALGVGYSLLDTVTGQVIINWNPVSVTGERPKCVSIGSVMYILYYDSAATAVKYLKFTSSGPGATGTLISNIDTTLPNFDTLVVGTTLYVGYNGTGSTVKIASFDASLTPIASVSKGEVASNGIGIFSDTSNNIWCAYANGTAVKAFIMNSALAVTVLAPTTVDGSSTSSNTRNVTGVYDGTKGIIFYDQPGAPAIGIFIDGLTGSPYVQPAVGSTFNVTSVDALSTTRIGQTVAMTNNDAGGVSTLVGYYLITAISGTTVTLKNLGYVGSLAPGAAITALTFGLLLSNVGGYSNAVISVNTLTAAGVAGTITPFQRSAALNSKAFLYNSVAHVFMIHDDQLQPTYFLGSLYNYSPGGAFACNITAKVFADQAGVIPSKSTLPNVNQLASGIFEVALQQQDLLFTASVGGEASVNSSTATYTQAGVNSVQIDFTVSNPGTSSLGNNLILGSGIISGYDGASVNEYGFSIFPSGIRALDYSASGGLLSNGTYGVQVTYEWTDNQGQVHQSAPSPVISYIYSTLSPGIKYYTIPTLRLTEKASVNIVVWRTTANGSVYYRLNQPNNSIPNIVTQDYVTYIDNNPDSAIIANQQLYTTGELENIAPPPSTVISNFKNRVLLVPADNRTSVEYSKQELTQTPMAFTDAFTQNVGSAGGELTAVFQMDDKMVLGKSTGFQYMVGSGPAASGAGNDFTDPLQIAVDAGPVDHRSLVLTPVGIIFKSLKGIYLLDRGLQAVYIGAPVETYNQYDVVAARLVPNTTQVRLFLSNGVTLMYDYFYKKWASWTNPAGVSDCVFQGEHTYIASDGTVYHEAPSVYYDGTNTPVLLSFTTSWIKLAGLQGYQRIYFFYLLAEYLSAHQLQLDIAYNFASSPSQTTIITPNSTSFLENWRVFLAKQRCQSFQLTLTEIYGGTPGPAFYLSGLNLIVGVKSGFRTISADQSTG